MKVLLVFLMVLTSPATAQQDNKVPNHERSDLTLRSGKPKLGLQDRVLNILSRLGARDSILATKADHAHIFGIALTFDSVGRILEVALSENPDAHLKGIFGDMEKLGADIVRDFNSSKNIAYGEYRCRVVIFPILLKRTDSERILNLGDFMSGYESLWPKLRYVDSDRQKLLLKPCVWMVYREQVN